MLLYRKTKNFNHFFYSSWCVNSFRILSEMRIFFLCESVIYFIFFLFRKVLSILAVCDYHELILHLFI